MFPLRRYELEYYYTFREFVEVFPYSEEIEWYDLFHNSVPYAPLYTNDSSTPPVEILKPYINDLLNLVYSRFGKHYIYWSKKDTLDEEDVLEIALKLANIIMNTYDKYAQLYKYYKDKENSLMDMISSTNDAGVGYNDTPQNGGDFADENHRTNFTETHQESKTEGATPIERLSEIKDKLSSILFDWSEEFDRIFLEEGNI